MADTVVQGLAVQAVVAALVVLALVGAGVAHAVEPVLPGEQWQTRSPGDVGLDADRLEAFSQFVGGRGCVTRYGYMIHTWGNPSQAGDVASACKPFFSHFLFKALEDGRINGLDEPVVKYESRLADINPSLAFKDRQITWRHMANQTSCYQVADRPGTAFCYNDFQMALFWDTLFQKIYGTTYETVDAKVFGPMLTDVLGCQDNPTMMAFGTGDRPGRVKISPRDFCRFGLLYLHRGQWGEKQLIGSEYATMAVTSPLPAELPRASMVEAEMIPGQRTLGSRRRPDNQCDHRGSYSFLWWTNGLDARGRRSWPGVPADAYGAFGHGGPRAMVVIPSLSVVLSWNDARTKGQAIARALKLLVDAVADSSPSSQPSRTP